MGRGKGGEANDPFALQKLWHSGRSKKSVQLTIIGGGRKTPTNFYPDTRGGRGDNRPMFLAGRKGQEKHEGGGREISSYLRKDLAVTKEGGSYGTESLKKVANKGVSSFS